MACGEEECGLTRPLRRICNRVSGEMRQGAPETPCVAPEAESPQWPYSPRLANLPRLWPNLAQKGRRLTFVQAEL